MANNPRAADNLTPPKKGEVRNPWGSKGKSGEGGFSLKRQLKIRLAKMESGERDNFFEGLILKAREGDHQAMKLLLMMNDEPLEAVKVEADAGIRINISLPPKEETD